MKYSKQLIEELERQIAELKAERDHYKQLYENATSDLVEIREVTLDELAQLANKP